MTDQNDVPATDTNSDETAAKASESKFSIKKLYLKDASFESPMGIQGVASMSQAKVSQDLNTEITKLDASHVEVVLKLTVTVKLPDDKIVYLVEVHQAGIFLAAAIEGQALQQLVTSVCPQIIFPYLRETVDNLVIRGGFPALALPPINFDAVYAKARAQAQKEQAEEH